MSQKVGSVGKIRREAVTPILEQYAEKLHVFQFDKARDIVEEFRSSFGASADARHTAWQSLLQSLSALTQVEKSYLALTFMAPKGFLRTKTQLKTNYNAIRTELHKTGETLKTALERSETQSGESVSLAEHLLQQFHSYICARIDMMNFYEKLALVPTGKGLNLVQATELLEEIQERHTGSFHHPIISKMDSGFCYEVEILLNLLKCEQHLSRLAFLPSLFHLLEAHSRIKTWLSGSTTVEETTSQVSSWFGFGASPKKQPVSLDLCIWLQKFYDCLISKFSLYFYDILSRQAPPPEIKQQLSKVPINFAHKLTSFSRKQDAQLVCLIMDATGIAEFQGIGYHHPEKEIDPLKGLECFPVIFSYPIERPTILLPSIVMLIEDNSRLLEEYPDRIAYTYDSAKSLSFFVSKAEEKIYLISVIPGRKQEKDSAIVGFIQEINSSLHCYSLFSQLKYGVDKS